LAELMNIPGTPAVWHVNKSWFLVYIVPGTEKDPVYMVWEADSFDDVQSWFGPGKAPVADRTLSVSQFAALTPLKFGGTDDIPPGADNPFASWASTLKTQAAIAPWIMDDDYQALMAMALVEGRALTAAEIAGTKWWKTHNAAERQWMDLSHRDPTTAKQTIADRRIQVRDMLNAAGAGTTISQGLINYMADQVAQGHWTQTYFNDQVRALTDPYSKVPLDAGLRARTDEQTALDTNKEEDTVRDALSTWLGPAFGAWSEAEIKRQAGLIRNDPNEEQAFIERLKTQRLALLPMYTDREASYAAIANTWKQFWIGQWGQNPDEKDPLFMTVLKNNDMELSAKLLRKEGLARGIAKVGSDLSQQGISRLGDSERRAITP